MCVLCGVQVQMKKRPPLNRALPSSSPSRASLHAHTPPQTRPQIIASTDTTVNTPTTMTLSNAPSLGAGPAEGRVPTFSPFIPQAARQSTATSTSTDGGVASVVGALSGVSQARSGDSGTQPASSTSVGTYASGKSSSLVSVPSSGGGSGLVSNSGSGLAPGPLAPASFATMPQQFKTLITACWQQNSLRRPTAAAVCKALQGLLLQQEQALGAGVQQNPQ